MYNRPGDELLRCCAGAQHLFIAAPYIKANALTKVLDAIGEISSLTCVTRWNPHDLAVGASDTKCRTIVKEHGGAFKLHPSLHAKYYRIDDDILIGSANLTFAAMGWSAQTNTEIICRPGSDFDAQAFQQKVLNEAREISDDEFLHWEAVAKASPPTENPVASITTTLCGHGQLTLPVSGRGASDYRIGTGFRHIQLRLNNGRSR